MLSHSTVMAFYNSVLISETGWAIVKIQIEFSLGHPDAYNPQKILYEISYLFTKKIEKQPKTWYFLDLEG